MLGRSLTLARAQALCGLAPWILALACCLGTSAVQAQAGEAREVVDGPPEYRALVTHALEEFDAQNYAEARSLFLRAHTIYPSARTLRALGMVEFELKNYVDSITRLEEALSERTRALTGQTRKAPRSC